MSNNNGPHRLTKGERRYKLELAMNHIHTVRRHTSHQEDADTLDQIYDKIKEVHDQIRWRSE